MKDILDHLERWAQEGKRFVLATVVEVERSAPRGPGATMGFCEDGRMAGSITGGCIESVLHEEAQAVLAGGGPKLATFGIEDEQGFAMGLSCGGTVHVALIEPVLPEAPVAIALGVAGPALGRRLALVAGERIGSLDSDVDSIVASDAESLLGVRHCALRAYGQNTVFIQVFAPPARLYIFGALAFAASLATVGKFLGYHVTVCDPRAAFATRERFPQADEVVVSWPDAFLGRAPIDAATAICVLSHDPKLDLPALTFALGSTAGYIGAMGSRRTHARRLEQLRAEGCSEAQLARIHAPIGLAIGSASPEQTAIAIAAEIISSASSAQAG
jgi:xanthine dehydrogenase accessory factor